MDPAKKGLAALDIKIALAAALCMLTAHFVPQLQIMTACISVLLCVQGSPVASWKAGLTRLMITAIGGLIGIAVVAVDLRISNEWLFMLLAAAGLAATLCSCKAAGVPYISARIGGVTFILVVFTRTGADRISYALLRFCATFYGVLMVLLVTGAFYFVEKRNPQKTA